MKYGQKWLWFNLMMPIIQVHLIYSKYFLSDVPELWRAAFCPQFLFIGNLGPYLIAWLWVSNIKHECRMTVLCLGSKHYIWEDRANSACTNLAFLGASSLLYFCSKPCDTWGYEMHTSSLHLKERKRTVYLEKFGITAFADRMTWESHVFLFLKDLSDILQVRTVGVLRAPIGASGPCQPHLGPPPTHAVHGPRSSI